MNNTKIESKKYEDGLRELTVYDIENMDEDEIDAILAVQEEITDEEIQKEWSDVIKEFGLE